MGAIDTEAKAYLSDRKRFADAFNFSVYDGDEAIRADDLKELDTTAIALPYGADAKAAVQKYRDLLKLYTAMQDKRAIYLVLGLEVQVLVHLCHACPWDALRCPKLSSPSNRGCGFLPQRKERRRFDFKDRSDTGRVSFGLPQGGQADTHHYADTLLERRAVGRT